MDDPNDPVRAWLDVLRLPAGPSHELVYAPFTREARLVTAARAALLFSCPGFATLDQHAARLAARGSGDRLAIHSELTELVRSGLLVSAGGLVGRARALAPRDLPAPPPIAAIGIPTRDRVDDVRACLTSYIENGLAHGRTIEYLVVEGEVAPATREATRASLAELSARHGVTIRHAGVPEKTAYAAALAKRAGVPRDLTEFALLRSERSPNDSGSNRNAIALHFAGEMHLHIDDDTRCRVAPAPGRQPGLALTSMNDPSESWFPARGAPTLPDRVVTDQCYVALHESVLGRNVCGLIDAARSEGLDMEEAGASFFRRLDPTGGRVLFTQIGAAGDTGTGSMWHYLLFRGPTRDRLHLSEDTYRRSFTGRQSVRAVQRASIADGTFCLGMTLGLDGRSLFPPFLPIQRNSDGLFGVVSRICWHDTFTGFLPWVIEHTPPNRRTSSFEAFFASLGHSWGEDILCALVAGTHIHAEHDDPRRALRSLATTLQQLGAIPRRDFEEILRVHVLRARSLDLLLLEDVLRRYAGSPAYWARDVEQAISLVRSAIERPNLAHASDVAEVVGAEEARAVMQRLTRRFGELLEAWPEILTAATELRREGVRLGQAVD